MAEIKKTPTSYWIKVAVFLFLVFGFGFVVPPFGGITPLGMKMMGVFLGMIYAFIALETTVYAAFICMFAMVLFGYMKNAAIQQGWLGTGTAVNMISFLTLTAGVKESGAAEVVAKYLITRKWAQHRPMVFSFVFLFAFYIAGAFLPPTANLIFSIEIFQACADVIGYDRKAPYRKWMLIGLTLSASFGTYGLPFKSMDVAILSSFRGALGDYAQYVNEGNFVIYTYLIGLVFTILFVLLMKLNKVDMAPLKDFDIEQVDGLKRDEIKMNSRQVILLVAFLIAVLYSFVPILIKKPSAFMTAFKSWGLGLWVLLVCAVLNIIHIDGEPVLNIEKSMKSGIIWRLVAVVGVLTMVGNALSDEALGIRQVMMVGLNAVFGGMSWPVFCFVLVAAAVILTNFMANQALGIVLASVVAPFAVTYCEQGVDITAVAVILCFAVQCAFLTYAAYATAPIYMATDTMQNESKFIWGKGWQVIVLFIIVCWAGCTFLGYIF